MNKQILESKPYENNAHKGSVYILRIATILLAIVSWWATAKGMENYVFSTQWQAYLASLAIQSILLGLNFYLPTFWRYSMSNFSKCGIGMLSMIVLFCSSWFSYVFIAEYSYKESWSTISRLLLQSSYREGLYGALEYAEEYDEVLRDIIWNQITELYGRAKIIEGNEAQVIQPMDLSQDSINYADNSEFAANREISTAIQFMRNALSENASASDQEEAVEQISELKKQVDEEINILENDIEREYSVIEEASNRLQKARENLRNALEGTDTIELENAVNIANENYETQQKKGLELENNLTDYQDARKLLTQYLGHLGVFSGGVGTQISNSLRSIQSNLLSGDVDVSYIEKEAREIFEKFQAAEDTLNAEDTVYQAIMTGLDSFMRNIQKYAEVQKSEQGLNQLINHLQQGNDKIDNSWKIIWLEELENLKSEIGGLPSYTGTESQMLLLYDRINEINKLDNALRMYISEHNAADQAMIYLFIPYRGLAVLSFLLALFLDISAFVTGFIIDIVDRRQMRKQTGGSSQSDCYDIEKNTRIVTEEFAAVPSTAQRYIFVTGDYTKEDGKYYYKALEGGELTEVNGQNLQMGFYVEISGKFCAIVPQELAFLKTHNGPQDGVYYNCYLQYSDNMLSIKNNTDEEYHYLATMNDSVPVYQIRNNECIIQDACDIPPQDWEIIIVALNAKGTQVAAIYLM